jgi:predicted nucleic acid-binding protein
VSVPISDPDDQPILDAAVAGAVDAIVTGDRAVLSLGLDRPRILTAREFLDWYPRSAAPPTTRFEEPTS